MLSPGSVLILLALKNSSKLSTDTYRWPMRVSSTAISPDPHGLIFSGSVAAPTFTSIHWPDRN
jgi:hypothetical protein